MNNHSFSRSATIKAVLSKSLVCLIVVNLGLAVSNTARAEDDRAKAQKLLNEQVLTRPFQTPSDATQNSNLKESNEQTKPNRSKTRDSYYRYWYNGYYYPYPYSYYGFPGFWFK